MHPEEEPPGQCLPTLLELAGRRHEGPGLGSAASHDLELQYSRGNRTPTPACVTAPEHQAEVTRAGKGTEIGCNMSRAVSVTQEDRRVPWRSQSKNQGDRGGKVF